MKLRYKLSLALLVLGLAPLVVVTAVIVNGNVERLEGEAKQYRLATAEAATSQIWSVLDKAEAELKGIGAALSTGDDQGVATAKAMLLGADHVHAVAVYDPKGMHPDVLRAQNSADLPDPPASLDEEIRGIAREAKLAWMGTQLNERKRFYQPLVVPVMCGEPVEVCAYLWTAVPLDALGGHLAALSKRRFSERADRVFVIDHALRVVAHGLDERVGASLTGDGAARDLSEDGSDFDKGVALANEYSRDGEELLGVIAPIPELRWGVIVEQSRELAYASARESVQSALWVGLGAAGIAILFGTFLGLGLAAPITRVGDAAARVAKGDFEARVPDGGRDEVGQMARAFNTMAQDLQGYEAQVKEEARIRGDLSRYLNGDLVESIMRQETELKLGGERREVTVMFADIVSFTPLAEEHDPEHLVAILNELFTFVTEIIFRHGGIIDKFMGDCVMAVFGTPTPYEDAPLRAVRAAEEIMSWLDVGNARWAKEIGRPLEMGIGIHTGIVIAGNIGSEKRMEYTVIGSTVNIAARIESISLPGQVLMSGATAARVLDEFDTEALGTRELRGTGKETEIHALQM